MPRQKSRHSLTRVDDVNAGFSLLELTVVVVVLGILSSVTLPRIGSFLAFADVDTAKALLNSAAADCLQNSRLNTDDKDLIDDAIISDTRMNPIGFKIDKSNNADKCSYFQLLPTDEDDNIRFPIGFSVSDGALSKFANPTSTDKGSVKSCETWAGVNCKPDESLKTLIEWKNQIAADKAECEDNYTQWLTEDNTTPFEFQRWNPNAESGCPSRPPKDGSESYKTATCTTNGCNRAVYGLDGNFVGFTQEDYDRALEEKYGKLCTDWVNQKELNKYTNDPLNTPVKKEECGEREFWFVDGTDYGSKANLDARLIEKASEKCEADRERARASGFIGKWGPKEGPGECGKSVWMCEGLTMTEEEYYSSSECGKVPEKCTKDIGAKYTEECFKHETNPYHHRVCGPRPAGDPQGTTRRAIYPCGGPGRGAPMEDLWDRTEICIDWAKCMGYY